MNIIHKISCYDGLNMVPTIAENVDETHHIDKIILVSKWKKNYNNERKNHYDEARSCT